MTNPPRRAGTAWERAAVDYAVQVDGLPWDRAPLRGKNDLGDVQGCLPDGWLIECKALSHTQLSVRLSEAMNEAQAARAKAVSLFGADGIVPVVLAKRRGKPVGQAYVVMEYDDFLGLVLERRKWRGQ